MNDESITATECRQREAEWRERMQPVLDAKFAQLQAEVLGPLMERWEAAMIRHGIDTVGLHGA